MTATVRQRATARDWIVGARLKTMPATFGPVAVGTALAYSEGTVIAWRAALTMLYALCFVIGTNYFNDYSDGIRGTDTQRVGPVRLVGSGRVAARTVLAAGIAFYLLAALTGLFLAITVSWWLLALTVFCGLGGWFYTGGATPYGYRSMGEVGVFLFHGVIAVCGTVFIQLVRIPLLALGASIPVGLIVCALLVTNNLRDIPTDTEAGKITLAVVIGDRRTRVLYLALLAATFATALALTPARPWVLLVLAALPFGIAPVRRVVTGMRGADLVAALEQTCVLMLAFAALFTVGLAL
jgi:1,4-dihydroxy-2-naphthoate octaprenyltransferase